MKFNYHDAGHADIIARLKPFIDTGDIVVGQDDKLHIKCKHITDSPWIHAKHADHRLCPLYFSYFFHVFGIIHPKCMECWKVVARPKNLSEMVEVLEWQKQFGYPAKCGVERRPFVYGNYGSYWYGDTKEEGLWIKGEVQKAFPDIPILLKRGCTEFEMKKGPSDKWALTESEQALVEYLDGLFVLDWDREALIEPAYLQLNVMRRWVEFAYDRADETYLKFTNEEPLYRDYVTYDN